MIQQVHPPWKKLNGCLEHAYNKLKYLEALEVKSLSSQKLKSSQNLKYSEP